MREEAEADPCEADVGVVEEHQEEEVASVPVEEVVVVVLEAFREAVEVDSRREEGVVLEVAFREGADEGQSWMNRDRVDFRRYGLCIGYMAAKAAIWISSKSHFTSCCFASWYLRRSSSEP